MPTQHALLSASSSNRWIHCPPSVLLSEQFENKTSDFARQGTDAIRFVNTNFISYWVMMLKIQPQASSSMTKKWSSTPKVMPPLLWKKSRKHDKRLLTQS